MGILRALIKLPILFWLFLIGSYLYYTHITWEAETLFPLREQVKTSNALFSQVQKSNKAAETFQKERDSRFQELQTLAETFSKALEKLPTSSDTPGFLSNLAEISDRVGIDFTRFEPGKPVLNGFLMETPFKVELKGSFLQVLSFLDEIAHLKRIVTGKSLALREPIMRGQNAQVKAEAVLITYYFDQNAKVATASTPDEGASPADQPAPPSDTNLQAAPQTPPTEQAPSPPETTPPAPPPSSSPAEETGK